MHFLIVDDHPKIRSELGTILRENLGYDNVFIDETGDASTAITMLQKSRYDLVLLDIALGEKSGLEVLKQVHSERPEQAILIVSMYPADMYARASMKMGAAGYLEKKFVMQNLPFAVHSIKDQGSYLYNASGRPNV